MKSFDTDPPPWFDIARDPSCIANPRLPHTTGRTQPAQFGFLILIFDLQVTRGFSLPTVAQGTVWSVNGSAEFLVCKWIGRIQARRDSLAALSGVVFWV
jgi:hypothetical protein